MTMQNWYLKVSFRKLTSTDKTDLLSYPSDFNTPQVPLVAYIQFQPLKANESTSLFGSSLLTNFPVVE